MTKEDFDKLCASIRQAGRIKRGEEEPNRMTEFVPGELTEAQRQELERRLAHSIANPDDVVAWEQVKAEALARFKQ